MICDQEILQCFGNNYLAISSNDEELEIPPFWALLQQITLFIPDHT